MHEQFPKPEEEKMTKADFIQLAKELSQNPEGFAFSGIEDESYAKLKASDEEYPGFTTPIDELIEKLTAHGFKIVFGDDPGSGNVHILPKDSDDIERDSVFPRHLKVTADMDERLKKLILSHKRGIRSK